MTTGSEKRKITFREILSFNGMSVLLAFVVLCAILSIASPNFLTYSNIMVVVRQAVSVGIISIGMTFIIATGEIDLSVGATVGITGMLCAALMKNYGVDPYLAITAAMAFGVLIGLLNAVLVAKIKIASFIATLAIQQVLRGFMYVYSEGIPIFGLDDPTFQVWAQGYVGPVPVPIIILAALALIFWYVMNRTKFGRNVLSVGSNPEGAKLVGINILGIKTKVYMLTGLLCGVAGIVLTARSEAAIVTAGAGYETDAIAAVVIAGTSMSGGKANLLGCILGAVLMTTIRNGLNLLKVGSSWHQVVIGTVILLALIFDKVTNKDA